MSQQGFARALDVCFSACSWCDEHAEEQAVNRVAKAVFCWNAWLFKLCLIFSVSTHIKMWSTAVKFSHVTGHETGKMHALLCPLQWECSSVVFVVSPTTSHTLAAVSRLHSLVSDILGKTLPCWKQQEFGYWFLWLSLNWLSKDFCVLGGALYADCLLTFFPSKGKPGMLPALLISALLFFALNFTSGAIALLFQVSDFLLGQDVIDEVKLLP